MLNRLERDNIKTPRETVISSAPPESTLECHNIKTLRETDLTLDRATGFFGRNSAGKPGLLGQQGFDEWPEDVQEQGLRLGVGMDAIVLH